MREVTILLAFLCLGMSLALFLLMGFDKRLAKTGARRVPERRLFLFALLGGAAGGLMGMFAFRHKTRHWYFVAGFWGLTLLQLAALGFLAYRFIK